MASIRRRSTSPSAADTAVSGRAREAAEQILPVGEPDGERDRQPQAGGGGVAPRPSGVRSRSTESSLRAKRKRSWPKANQSRAALRCPGLLRRYAPRNDECFESAESNSGAVIEATRWLPFAAIHRVMAGTQAPKGFGLLFVFVGIPLIIWSAAGTSGELEALDASGNPTAARIEQCVANPAELLPDLSIRRPVCECVVGKATTRDAVEDYGSYDKAVLAPIISECMRGNWD